MKHSADGAAPAWDVFISHASEDKDVVVRPLAEELCGRGLQVWYDEYELKIGDSLRESIEQGLARSCRAVVIISPDFFKKHWTTEELNGLTALEAAAGAHRVLPVWHNVDHAEVASQAPMLADRFAATTDLPIPELAVKLIEALGDDGPREDRLPVVALSAEITTVSASALSVTLRNVGSTHAMHVSLEPRWVEGRGVPLTAGYSETILAGASQVIELERFPPQDAEADALYDLLYSDPAEGVLKQQRLHFFLAPDVVTGGNFDGLAMEREGSEATFRGDTLEPWPAGAETLVQAWLFSQDWLLTGSSVYLRALRTLRGVPVDP